ncbi:MAG: MAPEG family protein [Pseudomonadota bacterium]
MTVQMILAPLFVQVLLTFAVMLGMMFYRTRSLLSGETRFESIALREPNWPTRPTQFAYAFGNQFELPVLFYVLTILAMITRHADLLFVILAWVFVVLRIWQALVHITNNNVRVRGGLYGLGAIVLLVMWIIFIVRIMLELP